MSVLPVPVSPMSHVPVSPMCLPAAINRADLQDTDMEAIMDTIVDSLFCFFVTLGESELMVCGAFRNTPECFHQSQKPRPVSSL